MEALGGLGFAVPAYMQISTIEEASLFDHSLPSSNPPLGEADLLMCILRRRETSSSPTQITCFACIPSSLPRSMSVLSISEYTIGVLSDMEGTVVNSIALRREIMTGLGQQGKGAEQKRTPRVGAVPGHFKWFLPGDHRTIR